MEATNFPLPFKFEIKKMMLKTSKGIVDIRGLMTELKLTQSIFENTMSAKMKILDSNDRLSTDGDFIITGGEILDVEFKAQNDKKSFKKVFYVDKITNIKKESNKGKSYILDLVTSEEILNNKIKISKAFTGKISNTIETILKEYLQIPDRKVEKTKNSLNYISPYIAPFKLINTLSKIT